MKIVITGDNHGDKKVLDKIISAERTADLFLHTGDSQMTSYELEPFISVKGNCDYLENYPETRTITTPIGKLLITHGHLLYKYNLQYLKDNDIKIFVTGHTHVSSSQLIDGIFYLNPGSIAYPRNGKNGTYLLLQITKDNISYHFKEIDQ